MYIYTYIQRCQVAAWKTTRLPTISNNSNSLFFNQPLLEASAAACCVHDRLIEYFYNNDWYDFRLTKWLEHTRRSTLFRFFYFFCSFSFVIDSIGSSRVEQWMAFPQLIRQLVIITTVSSNNCVDEPRLGPTRISLRVWYLILLDYLSKVINNLLRSFKKLFKICGKCYKNTLQLERHKLFHYTFAIFDILIRSYPNFSDRPEFFRSIRTFPIRSEVSNDSQLGASIEKVFQNFNIQNFFLF